MKKSPQSQGQSPPRQPPSVSIGRLSLTCCTDNNGYPDQGSPNCPNKPVYCPLDFTGLDCGQWGRKCPRSNISGSKKCLGCVVQLHSTCGPVGGGIVPHHWHQWPIIGIGGRNSALSLVSLGGIEPQHWRQWPITGIGGRNSALPLVLLEGKEPHCWHQWAS